MSTSSKAFKKLLKDESYFNKKVSDFLKFKGDKKKTGETAAEFLCNFNDKRSDIVKALERIKDVFMRITSSFEAEDGKENPSGTIFPLSTFEKSGKDYLYRLFELFEIDHKIFLYCLDKKWKKVREKLVEMEHRKKGGEIIDEFDLENQKSSLCIMADCCNIMDDLNKNGKVDDLTLRSGLFEDFKKKYSLHSEEVRKLFPDVADYMDGLEPSSKRRRPNPTEDD